MSAQSTPRNIDEYIAAFAPKVQTILNKIRLTIKKEAPEAEERISYRMPAFFLSRVLVYFAAFKTHIGLYPPVTGDAKLLKSLGRYRGPKGNLKFPLNDPIPYALIERIVKARVKELQDRTAAKRRNK